jgi:hypothetical protein
MLHSGYVEYAFFTGMPRYKDLFRTSSQWWAYNDCVQRCAGGPGGLATLQIAGSSV